MKIIYGTTNEAKLQAMRHALRGSNISIIGLNELNKHVPKVEESGNSPLENAKLKAIAYHAAFKMPVFSCDSGLYFDELPEDKQPGIHVRRVAGKELSDEEMLAYYASLAARYGGKLTGRYKNAIYLIVDDEHHYAKMDDAIATEPFILCAKPHHKIVAGFPLDSLAIDIKSHKYYYDLEAKDVCSSVDEGSRQFFKEALGLAYKK